MKKDNKKALYESIMTAIVKEVKKELNEIISDEKIIIKDDGDDLYESIITSVTKELKKEVKKLLNEKSEKYN